VLLSGVQAILGSQFVGMYLYGSLAGGDFNPETSDIDFLVVTAGELSNDLVSALHALHVRLAAGGSTWAARLEGSYITQPALRRYDPADGPFPCINEGEFYVARHGSDWIIQRHVLREHGVTLAGPAPRTLIDPVEPDDLRRAVLELLRSWWTPMLTDPARLRRPGYQAYAVLTMCRAHHALEHGTIVSKPAAARWAQAALGEPWATLIAHAVTQRHDAQPDDLSETLDFIRYTLERSRQAEEWQT
jgi:hypothetical protein